MRKFCLVLSTVFGLLCGTLAPQLQATETLSVQDDGTLISNKTIKFGLNRLQVNGVVVKGNSNTDNTSDLDKPVSTATQTALNLKLSADGDGSQLTGMTKTQVGLSNVPNVDATNATNITSGTIPAARLPAFIGATGVAAGTKGAVPAPAAGQEAYVLRGDGVWATVASAGGGTVTSVSVTTANGVSGSVANSTTTPAITLTLGSITPSAISLTGTGGAGFIDLPPQASPAATPATNHIRLYTTGDDLRVITNSGTIWNINPPPSVPPGTYTYTLPATDGVVVAGPDDATLPALDGSLVTGIPTDVDAALSGKQSTSAKDAPNGYAGLDATSKINSSTVPTLPQSKIANLTTDLAAKQAISAKGAANGYASLDSSAKVPLAQTNTIDVAHGGTNATSAAGARANLFTLSGNGGKALVVNAGGTDLVATATYPKIHIVQLSSGSGTYTPTAGTIAIEVELVGGGGGGAGAVASASNASAGGGGGAGAYAYYWSDTVAASYDYVIGDGGAGGTAGNAGSLGGATSFGPDPAFLAYVDGGQGGIPMSGGTSASFSSGGVGGTASVGTQVSDGGDGGNGLRLSGTVAQGGYGGESSYGASRQGPISQSAGSMGKDWGGGGSGAVSTSGTGQVGGDGYSGIIFVREYIVTTAP